MTIAPTGAWAEDPPPAVEVDTAADLPPADVQPLPDEAAVNSAEDTAELNVVTPSQPARIVKDPDAVALVDSLQAISVPLHQSAKDSAKIGGVMFVGGIGGIALSGIPLVGKPLLVGGVSSAILGAGTLAGAALEEVAVFGLDLTSAVIDVYADKKVVYDQ